VGSYPDGSITMQLLSAYACLDAVPDLPLSPLSRQSATSKATAQRQKTDAVRQKFLNTDRGVDLLFIVDVTYSMAAWIAAVRAKIDLIIKEQVRTHIQHVHPTYQACPATADFK
jgi:Mg-chelatase subunit ChlD